MKAAKEYADAATPDGADLDVKDAIEVAFRAGYEYACATGLSSETLEREELREAGQCVDEYEKCAYHESGGIPRFSCSAEPYDNEDGW